MGWEEREHISVLNTSKKEKYIPPGLGHSQLLSLSHSSTLAPAWLRIWRALSYLSKGFCRQSSWDVVPAPTLSTP